MNEISNFLESRYFDKNYANNTIKTYERALKSFSNYLVKNNTSLLEIEPIHIRNYLAELGKQNYARRSIILTLSVIKSFYKEVYKQNLIDYNPSDVIDFPHKSLTLPFFLEQEEVIKLMDAVPLDSCNGIRDRAILEVLYSTGMRVTELVRLTINDLNLQEGTARCIGKGDKQRIVMLGEYAMETLAQYLTQVRPNLILHDSKNHPRQVFLSHNGRELSRSFIFRMIRNYGVKAKLNKKVSPHMLRHSFASNMLKNNADLRTLQALLGHSSIQTTEIYTHLTSQQLQETYLLHHPFAKKGDK